MAVDYETVREVLASTPHCVIAAASPDGTPWLSTVFFNYNPAYDLIWESPRTSRHSLLLQDNPRAAIFIGKHDQITGALFAAADAREVDPASLPDALNTYLHGPHRRKDPKRSLADYAPGSPIALYRASLHELYVLYHTKVNGYTVEQREAADLDKLRGSRS